MLSVLGIKQLFSYVNLPTKQNLRAHPGKFLFWGGGGGVGGRANWMKVNLFFLTYLPCLFKFSLIPFTVDQEIDVELSLCITLNLKFSHCYLSKPIKHTYIMLPGGVIQCVLNGLIKICPLSLMPIWRNTFLKIAIKYKAIHYLGRKKNHQLSHKDKQVDFQLYHFKFYFINI